MDKITISQWRRLCIQIGSFMREMEEMIMMREENFTQGEYVKKEDVMTYLRVFDWNMPREKLIEKFEEMPAINLTE